MAEIWETVSAEFPLSEAEVAELKANIAAQVLRIRDLEQEGVAALQAAMR